MVTWVGAGELVFTGNGHKIMFWDDRNVLCLELSGGHVGIYIGKILSSCILQICVFYCM